MSISSKIVLLVLVVALLLPFILVRDVYPFYRFGMFSKSVKHKSKLEKYYITTISLKDSTEKPFYAYPSQEMVRKYIYRKQTKQLLQKFHQSLQTRPAEQNDVFSWQIYTISIPLKNPEAADTVLTDKLIIDGN